MEPNTATAVRRALLSAVTLFGGHLLNRRLDRVVLIGTLLMLVVILYVVLPYALLPMRESEVGILVWAALLPLVLVGGLALLSAALTFRDARQPVGGQLTTATLISGVVLSFVGALVVLGVFASFTASRYAPTPGTQVRETRSERAAPTARYHSFYGYVHFGGDVGSDLAAPPSGPERLRGRLMLDGTGVQGAEVAVTLNGKYHVEQLKSDSDGVFEVRLPAGTWHINNIVVEGWEDMPANRDLTAFTGLEPTKEEDEYIRHDLSMPDGLAVSLPAASGEMAVQIELRDLIPITWPPRSPSSYERAEGTNLSDTDFSTAVIAWQPVARASEYEVQISHVTRSGKSARGVPILMRRLTGSTLPLASLPQRTVSGAPADEYAVQIYAFDEKGKLLTESSRSFTDRTFTLTGATRLGP